MTVGVVTGQKAQLMALLMAWFLGYLKLDRVSGRMR